MLESQSGTIKTQLSPKWLIYGANGYTGQLIAKDAVKQGLEPILAGRNDQEIAPLAIELGLSYRIFDLTDQDIINQALADINLVVLCAGPFSTTSKAIVSACIKQGAHYLDITGEIDVFTAVFAQHQAAKAANVVLCPGVGFDVIPTDCIAATLKNALPDANYLALGFDNKSQLSPGTMKTAIEGLKLGCKVRENGIIKTVPLGYRQRQIDFGNGAKQAVTIPWGDVATAYFSTHIPNIEVYIPLSPVGIHRLRRLRWYRPLLSLSPIQRFLKYQASRKCRGPSEQERLQSKVYVWGEVRNDQGDIKQAYLTTPNGYQLTVAGTLLAVQHLLHYRGEGGYFTPSQLMGRNTIESLPGTSRIKVTSGTYETNRQAL
ncbi:saccharopine dehydrogenase family protein [Spartinivicinus poritis]|uniref:Saccharopine dehydrogenase NADP-binding domain-containing protein n=1 Tax=Spartinivicinus poritis TaxID=2994640 RepID=A0ABT5UB93_9GAMM|nr:saccharopine dehydrogenase NADP-binding domain-containing protein [Spartinivicinus sp. A2-2]MDE1463656.1 saccharopine dehydrogenase NADP-binding domain-containing protein [Spartinivicinus sp. A2-2]